MIHILECLSPESLRPNHGIITLDEKEVTTYGATATVSCKEGYYWLEGSQKITCQNSKLWTQPLSTCQIKGIYKYIMTSFMLDDKAATTCGAIVSMSWSKGF